MATLASTETDLLARERLFFFMMSLLLIVSALLGFGYFQYAGISSWGAPWWVHVHAFSQMGWLGFYALQNALVVRGDEFCVVDHWDADAERGADTLSGGETFVVSLALALALAEQLPMIQAGASATLESLFLDEGFGTLDPDALEPVINAIEGLREEGRMVGVITHVPELAEKMSTRIEVHKAQGGSTITVV